MALSVLLGARWAQPSPTKQTLAETLFREGKRLMAEGKLDEACRMLEESHRLDPGGGTLLNIALCHEQQGRTATAWAEFGEALSIAQKDRHAERVAFAEEHLKALERRMWRMTVVVAEGADIPDLKLTVDGTAMSRVVWGTAIPIDPGEHIIVATAKGRNPWTHRIRLGDQGGTFSVPVPLLAPPERPLTAPSGPDGAAEPQASPASADGSLWHAWQPGAFARVDIDGRGRGAMFALGASYGLGRYAEVGMAGFIGRDKGLEPSLAVLPLGGPVKPLVSAAAPVFFVDTAYVGVRAGTGVIWDPLRHLGIFMHATVAYFPEVPEGYDPVVFAPSLGVQARL